MFGSGLLPKVGGAPKVRTMWSAVSSARGIAALAMTLAVLAAPMSTGAASAMTGPGESGSVYLVIGQSNAAGRGDLPSPLPVADGVFVLDNAGNFVPATPNLNQFSTIPRRTGFYNLGFAFGETIRAATGEDVHMVVNARGASNIRHWVPDGAVEPESGLQFYDEAVARTRIALEESGSTLAGVIWHQGESDLTLPSYIDELGKMVEALRVEFDDPDLPFIAGELSHQLDLTEDFNDRLPGVTEFGNSDFVTAEGITTKPDLAHFDTPGLRTYGSRYAAKMLELQGFDDN